MDIESEFLPGMKPKRIASLIDAAKNYLEVKDKLALLKKKLEDAESAVGVEMRKRKLQDYSFGGVTVRVSDLEKIKVARAKEAPVERHFAPGQNGETEEKKTVILGPATKRGIKRRIGAKKGSGPEAEAPKSTAAIPGAPEATA